MMSIKKENSCFNNLRWRVFIDNKIKTEDFIQILTSIGYTENVHPLYPKIIEMVYSDNHRIIFVPETNRIQIKLDIESIEKTRIETAKNIALKLCSKLDLR